MLANQLNAIRWVIDDEVPNVYHFNGHGVQSERSIIRFLSRQLERVRAIKDQVGDYSPERPLIDWHARHIEALLADHNAALKFWAGIEQQVTG